MSDLFCYQDYLEVRRTQLQKDLALTYDTDRTQYIERIIDIMRPYFGEFDHINMCGIWHVCRISMYIDSLKIRKFAEIFRALKKEGFQHDRLRFDDAGYFKDLRIYSPNGESLIDLDIELIGTSCKKVRTGTREIPVYSIQCD